MATVTNSANINTSAPTAAAPTANHSPRHSENSNHPMNSPQSRRAARAVSSPWTHIVRGESEPIAVTPSSPSAAAASTASVEQTVVAVSAASSTSSMADEEGLENGNGNAGKKPAWNKPSNGATEIGRVMDGSWPALSESARSSAKSSSDSLKGLSDGSSSSSSVSVSQGTGTTSIPLQKQFNNSANSNPTPNHTTSTRQRSMKRNVANTSANGGASQPSGSQGPGEVNLNSPSHRDHVQRSSQSRGASDQLQQRNSFRNRNGGSHSRGDGSHPHNHGGRRDQDRGNQDWNSHRNFNGKDAHMQHQRFLPRNMRHPPPPLQPTSSQNFPPRPFGGPLVYPAEVVRPMYAIYPLPESVVGMPFTPFQPYQPFFPPQDLELRAQIMQQIDYYFSQQNLIKDTFLRQNMDDEGWVPIKLISGFKKVSHLSDNIQLILDVIRNSGVVEVKDDKVRRRDDWMRWIMPPSVQFPKVSGPQSPGSSSSDMLSSNVQNISLDERISSSSVGRRYADVNSEAFLSRSTSGDSSGQSPMSASEEIGHVSK